MKPSLSRLLLASLLLLSGAACRAAGASERAPIELLPGLATYQRPVTAHSPEAQRFFDQGITLYWGFDHEEAEHSFARAAELEPDLAMAYWGQALSAGPNYNNPSMDEARSKHAFESLSKARSHIERVSPVERGLIAALEKRYVWPPPEDRQALDRAYADAMRALAQQFPEDADVGALFAESLMDLRPWDLWTPAGEPQPGTPELVEEIERVLRLAPRHPGACHLAIHANEASPRPGNALSAADRLRTLVPGAGHLVHMPSHIDIRLGHYAEAVLANQKAIEVDALRADRVGPGGFYAMYRAHNYHFLVYAAQFEGRYALALEGARALVRALPADVVEQRPQVLDAFLATPLHVLERFGRWDEILAEPRPDARFPVTLAFWHYSRALALSAQGKVDEATAEQTRFEAAQAAVPEEATIGNNTARTVLDVGKAILAGELEYRRGRHDTAFELLRVAVNRDEALHYDEPWGWFQPAAHALGALLLEQGRLDEAEAVYRRDLERHPDNGWALHGLEECLRKTGRTAEAADALARFRERWARADVILRGSCFCRTCAAG